MVDHTIQYTVYTTTASWPQCLTHQDLETFRSLRAACDALLAEQAGEGGVWLPHALYPERSMRVTIGGDPIVYCGAGSIFQEAREAAEAAPAAGHHGVRPSGDDPPAGPDDHAPDTGGRLGGP